jgi:hypothetical protein
MLIEALGGKSGGINLVDYDGLDCRNLQNINWYSITTTKRARFVLTVSVRKATQAPIRVMLIDVENSRCYGKNASDTAYADETGSFSDYIQNITDTSFQIRASTPNPTHNFCFWWY